MIDSGGFKLGEESAAPGSCQEKIDETQPCSMSILDLPSSFIHGFVSIASRRDKSVGPQRWRYLGLLQYRRHYPDMQLDSEGKIRRVWIFEFTIHQDPPVVLLAEDTAISTQALSGARSLVGDADDEIVNGGVREPTDNMEMLEHVRVKLLSMEPRRFEFFIKDLMVHCGFLDVCVTKLSADGGVDVNAKVGSRMWIFENTLVQVQAKRWLHAVGRREVAELRGSLGSFARGAVVTTSHFSKAAINEAYGEGKNPIALIDGFKLSKIVLDERFEVA